jgi:predicted nucleic acid-binding protein
MRKYTEIFKINYILDTHAWVEYFKGSDKGVLVNKLFLGKDNNFFTVACSLAELKCWALRNNYNFNNFLPLLRANSTISPITEKMWIRAADIRHEHRKTQHDFALIDAVILTMQRVVGGKVVSGDKHFRELKDVLFLG